MSVGQCEATPMLNWLLSVEQNSADYRYGFNTHPAMSFPCVTAQAEIWTVRPCLGRPWRYFHKNLRLLLAIPWLNYLKKSVANMKNCTKYTTGEEKNTTLAKFAWLRILFHWVGGSSQSRTPASSSGGRLLCLFYPKMPAPEKNSGGEQ